MAKIRLTRQEAQRGLFPPVCMRCGAEAAVWKKKAFSWCPSWVSLLILAGLWPYLIVALIVTKRMTVKVPLCAQHRNYWLKRNLFIYGGLVALIVLVVATCFISAAQGAAVRGQANDVAMFVCGGGLLGFVVWVIAAMVVQQTAMRPSEITDRSITLIGLAPEFVQAVREEREREYEDEDEEEEDRPRPKRRAGSSEQIYDPDAARSRPRGGREDVEDKG